MADVDPIHSGSRRLRRPLWSDTGQRALQRCFRLRSSPSLPMSLYRRATTVEFFRTGSRRRLAIMKSTPLASSRCYARMMYATPSSRPRTPYQLTLFLPTGDLRNFLTRRLFNSSLYAPSDTGSYDVDALLTLLANEMFNGY